MKRALLVGLFLFFGLVGHAHEIRPAYLQIVQIEQNTYQAYWKIPSMGEAAPKLRLVFTGNPKVTPLQAPQSLNNSIIFRYQLEFPDDLRGQNLYIEGLSNTLIDALVRVEYLNEETVVFMLQPDNDQIIIPGESSSWEVIKTYTILGVEHILFGIDHLLFVLALIIITVGFKKIVKTITAFTLAHSITLSMAVLGYANLPGPPVETVIALSIVFLALEIIKNINGEATLTSRKPWLVAFTFGLLHGFGFAGALMDIGLPQSDIPLALAFFNIGVELGQIAFVLVVLGLIYLLKKFKGWSPAMQKVPAYLIGGVAAYWVIDRVLGFWA
ncbi:HupE/UreJ family protein [Aureitalea marina]|uniref:HupE / UreJ protein n=1 Tax=Aureitalea marina TaxID=930804 RepID=A0A2S7KRX5_9FLAO|nr:HupE/UreJ family protein [Aureitalea marina]PQB05385.1 hypothetical protein BST85_11165 [Aureitalea marina]